MRRRVAATLALGLTLGAAGCGGGRDRPEGLSWEGRPNVFRAKNLPADRVLIARVRNRGDSSLHLVAADVKIRDAHDRVLKGSAAFTTTFAHGLFGALEHPSGGVPRAELVRLGKIVDLRAGASVPFYAAWRLAPGARQPVHIDFGAGSLDVPAATATTR